MAKKNIRRTVTLSISLPPELMNKVNARVNGGLYTSASELFREALRLLLEVQERNARQLPEELENRDIVADRLASTVDLSRIGAAIHDQKLRRSNSALTEAETISRRLAAWEETESDHVIRSSSSRLRRLRNQASSK